MNYEASIIKEIVEPFEAKDDMEATIKAQNKANEHGGIVNEIRRVQESNVHPMFQNILNSFKK